eukprot:scaffold7487_cov382-Pinguiococcus_pyrenoidosus.AAC.1
MPRRSEGRRQRSRRLEKHKKWPNNTDTTNTNIKAASKEHQRSNIKTISKILVCHVADDLSLTLSTGQAHGGPARACLLIASPHLAYLI